MALKVSENRSEVVRDYKGRGTYVRPSCEGLYNIQCITARGWEYRTGAKWNTLGSDV